MRVKTVRVLKAKIVHIGQKYTPAQWRRLKARYLALPRNLRRAFKEAIRERA